MKLAPLFFVAIFSVQLAEAHVWKVGLSEDPAGTPLSHTLKIDRGQVALIGAEDRQVLQTVSAKDVIAMWYDDRVIKSYGREWMDQMVQLCYELCSTSDTLMGPLILMAAGGTGYLASRPFEEHEHFVTVQFRQDGRSQFLIFRTTWAEHFWLMTDLSSALGRKWLSMPERRAALYWGLADRTKLFDFGSFVGTSELRDSDYDVMFWEDNKARGVVLLFGRPGRGTPPLVAAVPVVVEKTALRDYPAEYCTDKNGAKQVWRFGIGGRLFTLRSAAEACGKDAK
jgi:hypothetical protein